MAEKHLGILHSSGAEIEIEDSPAFESAQLFKFVSDTIWEQHPDGSPRAIERLETVLAPVDAYRVATNALGNISDTLVFSNNKKKVSISGMRGDKVIIPGRTLDEPIGASVTTFNWDERFNTRPVESEVKYDYVKFTDGHLDYARELGLNFAYEFQESRLVLSYVMQRYQDRQHHNTSLSAGVWNSSFAETGYEGTSVGGMSLSESQEIDVLTAIAAIGGISLEEFSSTR